MPRHLTGRVATGVGDLSRWMRRYARAYHEAAGTPLVPGSLNLRLEEELRLPERPRIRLEPEQVGVGVTLVPCCVGGRPAFVFRTDRNEAGIGHHARHVLEVVADVHLRTALGVRDGDEVEVVVPRSAAGCR